MTTVTKAVMRIANDTSTINCDAQRGLEILDGILGRLSKRDAACITNARAQFAHIMKVSSKLNDDIGLQGS